MTDDELFKQIEDNKKKKAGGVGGGTPLVPQEHQLTLREEAKALIRLINQQGVVERPDDVAYIASIEHQMKNQDWEPSRRQIFWLRDIKDRGL